MELENKHITVVGLGITGEAVAGFLSRRGARVTVTDSASENRVGKIAEKLHAMGVATRLGGHYPEILHRSDLIILSPGVPHTLKDFDQAGKMGIPVIGEIELASRFISEPIVAVTGTNGKTTTTTLLGEMLANSGMKTFVGGNIGNPLIGYVDSGQKADCLVVEISSFQLDTIKEFRPRIALLLNITDDHMDRYNGFSAYVNSKARIFENQTSEDFAVLNASDSAVVRISSRIGAQRLFFGPKESIPDTSAGCAVIEKMTAVSQGRISVYVASTKGWVPELTGCGLVGRHNLENISAAVLGALAAGGTKEGIDYTLSNFRGLPHRLEFVAEHNGIKFINDSKATNTDAVAKALEAFSNPQVVIMGGRDKDSDFGKLTQIMRQRVKHLILIGEAAQAIYRVAADGIDTDFAESMRDAVAKAYQSSLPGDVVLLAPGCASFDMYDNYRQRGEDFRRCVFRLISGNDHE